MNLISMTIELPNGDTVLGAFDKNTGKTYTLKPFDVETEGMTKIEKEETNGKIN